MYDANDSTPNRCAGVYAAHLLLCCMSFAHQHNNTLCCTIGVLVVMLHTYYSFAHQETLCCTVTLTLTLMLVLFQQPQSRCLIQ